MICADGKRINTFLISVFFSPLSSRSLYYIKYVIILAHAGTVLNFLDKVTPLFFLISYVYSKVFI